MFKDAVTNKIITFIIEIGIDVSKDQLTEESVFEGIKIDKGKLVIDEEKLTHPGDILHEAGHLAVKTAEERAKAHINVGTDPAEEMMAIAWSYAAILHLGLNPKIVFHEEGYKGAADDIVNNFQQGKYFGVPMLQWLEMTADTNAKELNVEPYPKMIKWLRD